MSLWSKDKSFSGLWQQYYRQIFRKNLNRIAQTQARSAWPLINLKCARIRL